MKTLNLAKYIATVTAATVIGMNGCTNPTSTAGSVNTYYNGVITDMEQIDIDTQKYNSTTNGLMGMVAGAALGNALNKHSAGTLVGAGVGYLVGAGASKIGDRSTGVRLTIDTDNGPMIVDMPFSCKYAIGKKVRLVSGSSQGTLMVENNGHYETATQDSLDKCPSAFTK